MSEYALILNSAVTEDFPREKLAIRWKSAAAWRRAVQGRSSPGAATVAHQADFSLRR
jgi:hypothetical protein